MSIAEETAPPPPRPGAETANDLGFGSVVARESRRRFLNRDGSFNVRREGLRFWESLSAYHYLLTISWGKFLLLVAFGYVLANAIYAELYVYLGPDALTGAAALAPSQRFAQAFFFSVHTLATIGYGNVAPQTLAANILVTIEALVGLVGIAMIAGIVFARFSRPIAKIVFSRNAIVAPFRGGTALMFRIVNQKTNQLVDIRAKVLLARRRHDGVGPEREFVPLVLERNSIVFFPLAWTIVHPIDEKSPLYGLGEREFRESDPELLVLLNAFDETFSQNVHTRSSYRTEEILWGARFSSIFLAADEEGVIRVDIRKLHDIQETPL